MSKTSTSTLKLAPVYRETFDRLFSGEKGQYLVAMRRSAMQSFEAIGLPGPRTEAWRYTNWAGVGHALCACAFHRAIAGIGIGKLEAVRLDGIRLVFENGRYRESLSSLRSLPAGAIVGSFARPHDHPKVKGISPTEPSAGKRRHSSRSIPPSCRTGHSFSYHGACRSNNRSTSFS